MRSWTLGLDDPLVFTLSSDFRLCASDFVNDHTWELETGTGDPSALALRTTYGLRACSMRIFPTFKSGNSSISNPADFARPLRLLRFFPNFLMLDFSPIEGVAVTAEYWIPDPHACAGRLTITNSGETAISLGLDLCGQLVPLDEGKTLTVQSMQSVNVLAGRTSNLAPVIFLTGGPQAGAGAHPSLALTLDLKPGASRSLTWSQAALADPKNSFTLARSMAARPWEAERTRIELVNAAQTVEIHTGDPDWDAALALSQSAAFRLLFGPSGRLAFPSFVLSRQPDHGHSSRGDGSDHPSAWKGVTALDALYFANLLPGAPEYSAGMVLNFLSTQAADGAVNWKAGPAESAGRWLAAPLLASLAWRCYQSSGDVDFLQQVLPGLKTFVDCWFSPKHDSDGDGFPEWEHILQTGLEDNPAFSLWQPAGQGADISTAESPGLAGMLCHEILSLACICDALGLTEEKSRWLARAAGLRRLNETCWNSRSNFYRHREQGWSPKPPGEETCQPARSRYDAGRAGFRAAGAVARAHRPGPERQPPPGSDRARPQRRDSRDRDARAGGLPVGQRGGGGNQRQPVFPPGRSRDRRSGEG